MLPRLACYRNSIFSTALLHSERLLWQSPANTFSTFNRSQLQLQTIPSIVGLLENKRNYSIGEYDKLWQAVSSGRGKGRSGKKKTKPKDTEGEFLKFGASELQWPGLNAPITLKNDHRKKRDTTNNDEDFRSSRSRIDPSQRGWSGTTWPGRHAGAPQLPNGDIKGDFDSIVIEVKKVSVTRASGKRKRTSAIVVVGNRQGSIGWAIGKAGFASAAIRKARNKAVNYLHHVPICEGNTSYGRRCQRIVRVINELAGIDNIRCKIVGRTTPLTVVRATFQGLQMQESHEELAERTGKYVVEYRPEQGFRPIVVAQPSEHAVLQRIKEEETTAKADDISKFFDPYRGAHRPKSIRDIQGTHPDVLSDV